MGLFDALFGKSYATKADLAAAVATLNKRMDGMASQQDVDALTQAVQDQGNQLAQVSQDVQSAHDQLQVELDNLAAQVAGGTPVESISLDGLKAAVDQNAQAIAPLDSAVQALGALAPTPPAEPPA